MSIITSKEILDLIVMTAAVGYLFLGMTPHVRKAEAMPSRWHDYLISTLVAAPAVVFHELGHKIVALALGLQATFHAFYQMLGLGILLKWFGVGIIVVPGFVSISGAGPLQSALSSFAGPGMNLALALLCAVLLKYGRFSHQTEIILLATRKLNWLLFGFNMIPVPPFDGFGVVRGLWLALGL